MARARGEESELNNATGQKTPSPRAASTMYFSLDDDGDVLAARPDRLYEVRPQDRVLRRTVEQNVDAVTLPSLDVPESQMGNQLVEVLRPPHMAEQLMEVPTIVSFSSLQQHTVEQIIDIPVPGRGGRFGGLQGFTPWTEFNSVFGADRRVS